MPVLLCMHFDWAKINNCVWQKQQGKKEIENFLFLVPIQALYSVLCLNLNMALVFWKDGVDWLVNGWLNGWFDVGQLVIPEGV